MLAMELAPGYTTLVAHRVSSSRHAVATPGVHQAATVAVYPVATIVVGVLQVVMEVAAVLVTKLGSSLVIRDVPVVATRPVGTRVVVMAPVYQVVMARASLDGACYFLKK